MLYTNHFIETLRSFPHDKILLHAEGKSIRAQSLFESSVGLALSLQKKGVQKGDRVILALKPGIEFLQLMYANMLIRTVVSIIDPEMGRENYRAKLDQFKPQHAFVDSRLLLLSEHPITRFLVHKLRSGLPDIPILKACQVFSSGPRLPILQKHTRIATLMQNQVANVLEEANAQDDFLVTYTSGTLAEPKGVVHSYASLSQSLSYLSELLIQHQDKSIATHLPHFALLGINAGITVHLWDNTWSAERKLSFIQEHKISTLFGPPSDFLSMLEWLEKENQHFPACLQNIYLGSAPVYSSFLKKLLAKCKSLKVTCLYGMTENLMVTHVDAQEKLDYLGEGDLVGKPFPNVRIQIAEDGEILLTSDQLFSRYWHLNEVHVPHHSGDLGDIDTEGRVRLHGRKKDMIIRGNFNVYPGLFEPTINKIDGIQEAVLIGIYSEQKADEEIILVVEAEKELSSKGILAKLQHGEFSIDKEAWPDAIIFMTLPRFGRQNKVDKKKLRAILNERR